MISGMTALAGPRPARSDRVSVPQRLPVLFGLVAGCLLLVIYYSPGPGYGGCRYLTGGLLSPAISVQRWDLSIWLQLLGPIAATALGLGLARWWPYLLTTSAIMVLPGVLDALQLDVPRDYVSLAAVSGPFLAFVALLAGAQGLGRSSVGWGAGVVALIPCLHVIGATLSSAFTWVSYGGPGAAVPISGLAVWHAVLLGLVFAGLAPVLRRCRRGDPAVAAAVGRWGMPRARLVLAGTSAMCIAIPQSLVSTRQVADLLGIDPSTLVRHQAAQAAVVGVISLVLVALFAATTGLWSLGSALIAATVQAALVVPIDVAMGAIGFHSAAAWLATLAGLLAGAGVAAGRWRFALAATFAVAAATALFIAFAATSGDPEKLFDQRVEMPGVIILVLCLAAAGSILGATAPVLAPRGALPVVLGPLASMLGASWLQAGRASYESAWNSTDSGSSVEWSMSAVMLVLAAVGIAGLGGAQLLAHRRAERRHAEQIRLEAAAAERDRLARPIHDGVLQVLALMQRQGSELGDQGMELAALAGEQEIALRSLLTGGAGVTSGASPTAGTASGSGASPTEDLRVPLHALGSKAIEVATPPRAVRLPAEAAAEVIAAVRAALDNVRRHAGDGARAWILLEDERDGVRVTVRDDGVGFGPDRLAEAAQAGRLGIAQSIRGRIADLGGSTTIESRPGEGTEVEVRVPRWAGGSTRSFPAADVA